jgi:hypothetical protein
VSRKKTKVRFVCFVAIRNELSIDIATVRCSSNRGMLRLEMEMERALRMGSGRIPADDAETSTVCDRARDSESGSSAPATAASRAQHAVPLREKFQRTRRRSDLPRTGSWRAKTQEPVRTLAFPGTALHGCRWRIARGGCRWRLFACLNLAACSEPVAPCVLCAAACGVDARWRWPPFSGHTNIIKLFWDSQLIT